MKSFIATDLVTTEWYSSIKQFQEVSLSSLTKNAIASAAVLPHIWTDGCKLRQTLGLSSFPNRRQELLSVNWQQRIPAGFPCGMPGIGDEIEGAMQQAAQPERQLQGISDMGSSYSGYSIQVQQCANYSQRHLSVI